MSYDYKEGKRRILDILHDSNDIKSVDKIPNDENFIYENGYYGWVTYIFVNIKSSNELFAKNKVNSTAKIIRCFTSEIIEILKDDDHCRELGIRGDTIYAIYATPKQSDIVSIATKAFCINSFMYMLNELLSNEKIKTIEAGIGLSTSQDLVIKAGRKQSKITSRVWIGEAVTSAYKLSLIANSRRDSHRILMTPLFYNKIIHPILGRNKYKDTSKWFDKIKNSINGEYYGCNLVNTELEDWIGEGMPDD